MEQLLAHLAGDYLLQNRWMATQKHNSLWVASLHGIMYTLPFLLITLNVYALLIICTTHIFIDYFQVGDRVMWVRESISPQKYRSSWHTFKKTNGSLEDWRYFYLRVIADNSIHLIINFMALRNFG